MSDTLSLIRQYETGGGANPAGANVYNYRYDATHTAQGYYQITNSNWNAYAPGLGIDTSQYPTAISAPFDQQTQVAQYMLQNTPQGVGNWSNYNPQLANALQTGSSGATGGGNVVTDPWGTGASTPTGTSGATTYGFDPSTGANTIPTTATQDPGSTATPTASTGGAADWITSFGSRGAMLLIGALLLLGAMLIFAHGQSQ